MELVFLCVTAVVCIVLVALVAIKDKAARALRNELEEARIENARLKEKIGNVEAFNNSVREETKAQFKSLAADIFSSQSEKFKEANETRLSEILNPLKEDIKDFKRRVDDTYMNSSKERTLLGEQMKRLMELNMSIGKEARDLTEALSGNTKVQGDWGEMVLETILVKSGLVEGENYFVQRTKNDDGTQIKNDDNGRLRPDVVVALPDKKCIVIDSKVSLTAYVNYINADNDDDRQRFGKAHLLSVRSHLKELETKRYQDFVGVGNDDRIDYVLMFIPNEHAYMAAMTLDNNLWMEAYEKRVVIISPAHVISTLRLIAQLWTRDKQTKNALKIAEEGGKLYDKFVGFVNDMQTVEQSLGKASEAYASAMSKLHTGRGCIVSKVENLKKLGAKTSKTLPSDMLPE
ncbi:MAG TPA: DNA recombination protein RmuC [Porphyromonadaceae bacterium]|jgi:DNA recombination protein RmuC|uniref:DNA recombination protein RmuC n=2 Tax=Candidatus Limisoma sp. TaxID=3076476 RepID=UPI000EBF436A|nr:DNA recombination protein RmuC [Muribaculaceae bacterium]HAM95153.1 DNA recombination protein RmuC [Porphyromonadaceae bacterium]